MGAGIIAGIVIIVLLLGLAVTFLILWLYNRNKKQASKDLSIAGLKFSTTNTSITGTWLVTGDVNNVITMYVDTMPINLDTTGKVEMDKNPKVQSATALGSVKTVTVNNLTDKTKYFVELVVSNPADKGFNPNKATLITGNVIPTGSFILQEIHTPGGISLDLNDKTKVVYSNTANKTDTNDLWSYDTANFTISTKNLGASSTAPRPTLYNNNGILAAKPATPTPSADSQWTYNEKGNNLWCIKGQNLCLDLVRPVGSNQEIKIIADSKTEWINLAVPGIL
tara:strand:+ start:851 stop:1693 length:843 start_codon:yes stop_codon:yes gene_type:complete